MAFLLFFEPEKARVFKENVLKKFTKKAYRNLKKREYFMTFPFNFQETSLSHNLNKNHPKP
jgi:hypothetical protein